MAEKIWREIVPEQQFEDSDKHDFEQEAILEGIYEEKIEKADRHNRDHYLIKTDSGEIRRVFSGTVLKKRFDEIEIGTRVKVEFMGLKPSTQGQPYKDFRVYVEDNIPVIE